MKKLKILGLFTLLLFMNLSIFAQEKVGENRNGTFVITASLNLLKPEWNKIANQTVTNYSIISETTDGLRVYYLEGRTANNDVKICVGLEYIDNIFYKIAIDNDGPSSTCTCSGCLSTGCDPRWFPATKVWACINGCLGCKKSVTATVKYFSSN